MSSFETKSSGGMTTDAAKSWSHLVVVPLVVGLITAAATLGTAFVSHKLDADDQACSEVGSRLDRIDDLADSGSKLSRLIALTAGNPLSACASYSMAVRERDELAEKVREGRSMAPDPSISAVEQPSRPTVVVPPSAVQAPKTPLIVAEPASARPIQTDEMVALAPAAVESSQGQKMPALTVTPHDASGPFAGGIGETLILRGSQQYELKPPQFVTTTYNVSKGTVMVIVDGQPYLTCKAGNSFHLFWKTAANYFVATYDRVAALTVTDQQSGKHLGISNCLDPLS